MGWVTLSIVAVVAVWAFSIYNTLVGLRQRVRQSASDIDVQLKQRHDLIPNLIETVKGYAAHERAVFDKLTEARAAALAAPGGAARAAAESALGAQLGRLMAVAEAYPDLKANANFLDLQGRLNEVEDKIAAARRFLNNAVSEFNTAIESFPAVLFARTLGFQAMEFFLVEEAERPALERVPQVKF